MIGTEVERPEVNLGKKPRIPVQATIEMQEKYSRELLNKITDLSIWLRNKFDEVQAARDMAEERWLKDLRQYRGRLRS